MPHLIWSPGALKDVQRLYRFLAPKSPRAAARAIQTLRKSLRVLAEHPEIGRPAPDMDPEFREWPIGYGESGYVALYRIDHDAVAILAIRLQKEAGYQD